MKLRGELSGILLAGGASRRFGTDKLLHRLPGGMPMALASARALHLALPRMIAVVRKDNEPLLALFAAHGIETVAAEHAREGMGASLAAGIAATPDAAGWLIALADMPFIRSQTIARVVAALRHGAQMAAPCYQGRRGHPVGFSGSFRDELLALGGDEGARVLLQRHAAEMVLLDCQDAGVLKDIDQR